MQILDAEQVKQVVAAMAGSSIYVHVVMLLATGVRRGELAGLQWGDLDLDACTLRIERSIEKTVAGLRVKAPKTKHGKRTIAVPLPPWQCCGSIGVLNSSYASRSASAAYPTTPSCSDASREGRLTLIGLHGIGGAWRQRRVCRRFLFMRCVIVTRPRSCCGRGPGHGLPAARSRKPGCDHEHLCPPVRAKQRGRRGGHGHGHGVEGTMTARVSI